MNEQPKTTSIVFHLRRVVHQDAFVAVPVTDAIMKLDENGQPSIDWDAFVAQATQLGQHEGADWQVEEMQTAPHPVQCPIPEGRQVLDGFRLPENADE